MLAGYSVCRLDSHIHNLNSPPVDDGATGDSVPIYRPVLAHGSRKHIAYCGTTSPNRPIYLKNDRAWRVAKSRGAVGDRIENRLNLRRRAGDDLENFTGRGLLLQGFGQIAIANLNFIEQADILDGDHCLVGKVFSRVICVFW